MKVIYLPIEPYRERYTELLRGWTESQFQRKGLIVHTVLGESLGSGINTGRVLDAHGRSHWSLTQMAALVRLLGSGGVAKGDAIYFDDMFTPGYEALPYILHQCGLEVGVFARNHAQSIDCYDFTHPMRDWMRPYEIMVHKTATAVLCASKYHRDLMHVANLPGHTCVVGLPFDADSVRSLAGPAKPRAQRERIVVWSSRWDEEKQPGFFMDMVERITEHPLHGTKFIVCTGAETLRSTDPELVKRAMDLQSRGRLTIKTGCTKQDYYSTVASARVHFLASLQDFVSYALLDASALGTPSLAPAFRAFPETLSGDPRRLYVPWSLDDACDKLERLLDPASISDMAVGLPAAFHSTALERIGAVMVALS